MPPPRRIVVIALLVYIVFSDGGNRVESSQRLRLGLGRTTNGEMAGGEGARGPTDAKAPPLSALAISGEIEHGPFAVEYAPWPESLHVGAYVGDVVAQQAAAAL